MKEGYRPQQTVQPEATPQGGPERQPLPSVLDVLERRAQVFERSNAWERRKFSREENKAFVEECQTAYDQHTNELEKLYTYGTNSDRLILTTFSTLAKSRRPRYDTDDLVNLRIGFISRDEREFISHVAPLYGNEDALREELRKAQEELDRKRANRRKRDEFRLLPPEETAKRRQEAQRESARNAQQRFKERRARLRAEQQPHTQVFPPPHPAKE